MESLEIFKELKKRSGSHSPSIEELKSRLGIEIKVDACFLSNPYATELFLDRFHKEVVNTGKLRDLLEFYPQQNTDISRYLSNHLCIPEEQIFVGNGAIEIIQGILHNFVDHSIAIPIPTFSSYYEFVVDNSFVHYFQLDERNNYQLNLESYIDFIEENNIKNALIINPNNPDGGYISINKMIGFIERLKHLNSIIIDESFGHFAYEDENFERNTLENLVSHYPNVILVKSMSKDFGIAGIRAGYSIMNSERKEKLLSKGYLWNLNGIATYFFKLYCDTEFQSEYEILRKKYISNTIMFIKELSLIKNVSIIPSKANFILMKVDGYTSSVLMFKLLSKYGIYVRDCSDKLGLAEGYVRIASRNFSDNQYIVNAIKEIAEIQPH